MGVSEPVPGKPATPDNRVLEPFLVEYESLRAEIFSRLDSQRQAFQYLVAILAATVGLYAAKQEAQIDWDLVLLALPVVVAPFGFIFFDNEFMIFRNGFYIQNHLRLRISEIVGHSDVLAVEKKGFRCLYDTTCFIHSWVSYGRWSLFLLPTLGPSVYALLSPNVCLCVFRYGFLLILDFLFSLLLISAVIATMREHRKWKHLD